MPKRLGPWRPIPTLLPWPPPLWPPQKGVYESPSPATSHLCLHQPSAHRHIGFQSCPAPFLSPPSRASALDGAFGIQGSGVLQRSWGEKGKTAPKMADMATHLCLSLTNEFSLRTWHSEGIPTSPATALGPRPQCQPPLPRDPPHSWCLLQLRVPYLTTPSFPVPTKEAASLYVIFI